MVHVLHPSRLRCRRRAGHHTAAPAANLDPCLHDKLESRSCHKQDLPKPAHTLLPSESIPNAHPTRTTAGMRAGKKQLPVGDHNSSARSSRNTDTVPKIEPHPPRGGLGPPGNTSTGKTGQGRAGPGLPSLQAARGGGAGRTRRRKAACRTWRRSGGRCRRGGTRGEAGPAIGTAGPGPTAARSRGSRRRPQPSRCAERKRRRREGPGRAVPVAVTGSGAGRCTRYQTGVEAVERVQRWATELWVVWSLSAAGSG